MNVISELDRIIERQEREIRERDGLIRELRETVERLTNDNDELEDALHVMATIALEGQR